MIHCHELSTNKPRLPYVARAQTFLLLGAIALLISATCVWLTITYDEPDQLWGLGLGVIALAPMWFLITLYVLSLRRHWTLVLTLVFTAAAFTILATSGWHITFFSTPGI